MEKAADGIERGQEKEAAGIERGQDKAAAGIERGQDKQAAGLDRANAQIEKHLDNNPNVPANVPAYVPKLGVFGAQVANPRLAGRDCRHQCSVEQVSWRSPLFV